MVNLIQKKHQFYAVHWLGNNIHDVEKLYAKLAEGNSTYRLTEQNGLEITNSSSFPPVVTPDSCPGVVKVSIGDWLVLEYDEQCAEEVIYNYNLKHFDSEWVVVGEESVCPGKTQSA